MQVVLDEAKDAYKEDIVWERPSNSPEEMEQTAEAVGVWLKQRAAATPAQ